jgi:hypothetical protein
MSVSKTVRGVVIAAMPNVATRTAARGALTVAVIVVSVAGPADARQDPGAPNPSASTIQPTRDCPLTRVGTQFVRCDNLTGAGVPAPPWVPES